VPLLITLKYIWRSLQPRLSFPRPFQLSLACFRVARSPSSSWASCHCCNNKCMMDKTQVKSPSTSPLFCNHATWQKTHCCIISMLHVWFIDVSSPSSTLKVGLTVILNKRRYSSEIVLFDMFTVILHNTFKTTTWLIDAAVNETLSLGDYRSLQFFHRVKFLSMVDSLLKGIPNSLINGIKIRAVWEPHKATYIRFALWQKRFFFGPSSVKRSRTHIVLGWNM